MKRFLIFLNCKAVDDRQTEKVARCIATKLRKKYPARYGHMVDVYDSLTGEYIF